MVQSYRLYDSFVIHQTLTIYKKHKNKIPSHVNFSG